MGMTSETELVQKLEKFAVYLVMFQQAFGSPEISLERITQAIASYERTLITPNSAYDRYVQGDESALNLAQKRGMVLFEQTGCVFCHSGANFSGASYLSDTGRETFVFPAMNKEMEDLVSFELLEDKGALSQLGTEMETKQAIWRVPSLRNVTLTAPYFHNGSVETFRRSRQHYGQSAIGSQCVGRIRKRPARRLDPTTPAIHHPTKPKFNRTTNRRYCRLLGRFGRRNRWQFLRLFVNQFLSTKEKTMTAQRMLFITMAALIIAGIF